MGKEFGGLTSPFLKKKIKFGDLTILFGDLSVFIGGLTILLSVIK